MTGIHYHIQNTTTKEYVRYEEPYRVREVPDINRSWVFHTYSEVLTAITHCIYLNQRDEYAIVTINGNVVQYEKITNNEKFNDNLKINSTLIWDIIKTKISYTLLTKFFTENLCCSTGKYIVLCFYDFTTVNESEYGIFAENIKNYLRSYFNEPNVFDFFLDRDKPKQIVFNSFLLDDIDYNFTMFKLLSEYPMDFVIVDLENHKVISP